MIRYIYTAGYIYTQSLYLIVYQSINLSIYTCPYLSVTKAIYYMYMYYLYVAIDLCTLVGQTVFSKTDIFELISSLSCFKFIATDYCWEENSRLRGSNISADKQIVVGEGRGTQA